MAISGNWMVLRILGSVPSLRTPANMLVMNLAVSDFLLMITLIPECVYNFFTGGPWQFGDLGCQIHAFCGLLIYFLKKLFKFIRIVVETLFVQF